LESKGLGVLSNFGNHPKKLLEPWSFWLSSILRFSCAIIIIIIIIITFCSLKMCKN
jgi:hypothetical protein